MESKLLTELVGYTDDGGHFGDFDFPYGYIAYLYGTKSEYDCPAGWFQASVLETANDLVSNREFEEATKYFLVAEEIEKIFE